MERCLVKPLNRVGGVTRCTVYESTLLPFQAASLMLWYREDINPERFARALARVLSDYAIYAGRLYRDGEIWCIEHGSGGATLEIAESSQPADSVPAIPSRKHIKEVCPRLAIFRASRGKAPLLACRLTKTPAGTVLGVTWHHIVGDLHSTSLFLKALAQAYQEQPYRKPLQVADRQAYLSERVPAPTENIERASRLISWWEALRRVVYFLTHPLRSVELKLSWDEIGAIHAAATSASSQPVTVHDALSAVVFDTIRQLHGSKDASDLVVTTDYRKRFGLPANLLGNMIDLVCVRGLQDAAAPSVAIRLRERMTDFQQGPLGCHEMPRWNATYRRLSERLRFSDGILDPIPGNLYLTSMLNLRPYKLAFESEGPVLARIGEIRGVIHWTGVLLESPRNEGVTACMRLPAAIVRRLQQETPSAVAAG